MANETKLTPAEQCIKDYLDNYASQDAIFSIKYLTSGKTIKGAMTYITTEAQKQKNGNCACITSHEVFGWAVHYFDEDSLNCEHSAPVAKVETSSASKAPASKPAATKKTATPKTAKTKPATVASQTAPADESPAEDTEVFNLFEGLF